MSTPLDSTKETGRISVENRTLFFAALSLTTLGISGLRPSLPPFLEKNCEIIDKQKENIEGKARGLRSGVYSVFIIALVAVSSMSYINRWSIKFGLPAICTTATTRIEGQQAPNSIASFLLRDMQKLQ
ncbi:hypothetical protein V6N12_048746 [Hibiscus sabdariffa]|uniref:Uncharacterized protein n=1 Tax=Hibiscus sabdariffa TaxID=183260 RepID=A0ABR2EI67_9ROSI